MKVPEGLSTKGHTMYYVINVTQEQKKALVALGIDVVGAQNAASMRTIAASVLMKREGGASAELLHSVIPNSTEISADHLTRRCGMTVTERDGNFYIGYSGERPTADGELNRFVVPVRCVKPEGIEPTTVIVFSDTKEDAREAATEKMMDKYLRHQNLQTEWVVTGEPQEG
jgi:hypothetical protein